jgi:predicted RNA-binding protein YlqC (UPF0109 family)
MSSIDQQFVEYIVKSLVGHPDDVKIERRIDEKGVLLELTVNPEDLGRVIGKRGATAQSIRSLLRALGTKNDARYNLKIVDNGEPRPQRYDQQQPVAQPQSSDDQVAPADDVTAASDEPAEAIAEEPAEEVDSANEPVAEEPSEEPAEDEAADEVIDDEDADSGVVSKTRKELEELDDLDV